MKTVQYSVKFEEKASRLELLVRLLWAIPSYIVVVILEIIGGVAICLQWLHILISGRRNKTLHEWSWKFAAYWGKFMAYFLMFTDERSPILPED